MAIKKKATKKASPKKAVSSRAKVVAKNVVTRKPGMLYYVDKGGSVMEKGLNRSGGKVGRKICK